jgi:hypothetical protein
MRQQSVEYVQIQTQTWWVWMITFAHLDTGEENLGLRMASVRLIPNAIPIVVRLQIHQQPMERAQILIQTWLVPELTFVQWRNHKTSLGIRMVTARILPGVLPIAVRPRMNQHPAELAQILIRTQRVLQIIFVQRSSRKGCLLRQMENASMQALATQTAVRLQTLLTMVERAQILIPTSLAKQISSAHIPQREEIHGCLIMHATLKSSASWSAARHPSHSSVWGGALRQVSLTYKMLRHVKLPLICLD